MFDDLDEHAEDLGVVGYGISVTTKEVFLRVAMQTDATTMFNPINRKI